jgi:GR25 family glycosyltransferase involved in LPS biosynthesis
VPAETDRYFRSQLADMSYVGFYINLDRSPQRRDEIIAQLKRLELLSQYSRFPAADGNVLNLGKSSLRTGEIGVFTSHYLLLKKNLTEAHHLHVIEDHVVFSGATKPTLQMLIDSRKLDDFDIVFTDNSLPFDLFAIRAYKALFDNSVVKDESGRVLSVKKYTVIDLKNRFFASASSYLVNKNSIAKLHNILKEEIETGPRMPVDLFMRAKVYEGTIRAGCIFPFVTSMRPDHIFKTTIQGRYESDLSVLASLLMRYSFFVECDWTKCNQLIKDYFTPVKRDMHLNLLSSVFEFVLSDKFKVF